METATKTLPPHTFRLPVNPDYPDLTERERALVTWAATLGWKDGWDVGFKVGYDNQPDPELSHAKEYLEGMRAGIAEVVWKDVDAILDQIRAEAKARGEQPA